MLCDNDVPIKGDFSSSDISMDNRVILTPSKIDALDINNKVLNKLPGDRGTNVLKCKYRLS